MGEFLPGRLVEAPEERSIMPLSHLVCMILHPEVVTVGIIGPAC